MDENQIKFKNNWDFIVYENNEKMIISVVFFNSFSDHSKSFVLNEDEKKYSFEQFKTLAEQIRNNYESYKLREIPEL